MLRPALYALAALFMVAHTGVISCDDHHHDDGDFIQDVTVEITGDSGTNFHAFFEDDDKAQSFTADVPFSADFADQENFFRAIVDKDSSGGEEICVRLTTPHRIKEECTDNPFGRVTVTIVF